MVMKKSHKLFVLFSLVAMMYDISSVIASPKYINIATGNITGVYYPSGGAICRFVNRGRKDHNIRCSAESTGGSVSNLNSLRKGGTEFAIVQSDWQYHAYNGTGFFADQAPFRKLRSIFSLYTETFTLAVRKDSGIKHLDGIVGKKVNFGPQGSGMYATMEVLSEVKGWDKKSFSKITNLDPSDQVQSLCAGDIDVMIYTAGNPNGILQEATQNSNPKCKVRILSVDKKSIKKLIRLNPFYVEATIPGGMYRGNPDDIHTFGVKATVVTSSKISSDVVYNLTKAVFSDFGDFKTLHPVFSSLNKKEIVQNGNYAPLHKGAMRYYEEVGLRFQND
ncbi:MAG: TRAP transporter TAXI family solute receptor [Myxococcota bacterium]|jgi:TRAP transporter TAXI family solute receptor